MSKKKASSKGILKAWAKEPKEDWDIFIDERTSAMGTAVSNYRLTARRHEAIEVVRDLIFARARKSRKKYSMVGKLYKDKDVTNIPEYACCATGDEASRVVVRKSREGRLPPLA